MADQVIKTTEESLWKLACQLKTVALLPTYTVLGLPGSRTLTATVNGTLQVDGVTVKINDRILVDQIGVSLSSDAGIYTCTNAGSASAQWVLKQLPEDNIIQGRTVLILGGIMATLKIFKQMNDTPVADTDPQNWINFNKETIPLTDIVEGTDSESELDEVKVDVFDYHSTAVTTGGTATPLPLLDYEEYDFTTTFTSGNYTTAEFRVQLTRNGRQVTMAILDSYSSSGTTPGCNFVNATKIPNSFVPASIAVAPLMIINNGRASQGCVAVHSNGDILIWAGYRTQPFTAGGTGAIGFDPCNATWSV